MSLYDDASLIMYPSGVKASKIYSQKPTDGSGDLTFTRAGTATYIDANGARQTAASNVPRIDYTGGGCGKLLLEPQRTNLLLNSATLSTQNITTTAQSYVLSFEGTGTVTLSGTYSGSLVGTGSTPADRVNLVFTATAGTLTVTVSGSVLNAQTELGTYPTSYIPTTSTVTRLADNPSLSGLQTNGIFGATQGTIILDMTWNEINYIFDLKDASNTRLRIFNSSGTDFWIRDLIGASWYITGFTHVAGERTKIGITWNGTTVWAFQNGVKAASSGTFASSMAITEWQTGSYLGETRLVYMAATVLSDAEIIELTTL